MYLHFYPAAVFYCLCVGLLYWPGSLKVDVWRSLNLILAVPASVTGVQSG